MQHRVALKLRHGFFLFLSFLKLYIIIFVTALPSSFDASLSLKQVFKPRLRRRRSRGALHYRGLAIYIYILSLHIYYLSNTSSYTIFLVFASSLLASQIALILDMEVTLEIPT